MLGGVQGQQMPTKSNKYICFSWSRFIRIEDTLAPVRPKPREVLSPRPSSVPGPDRLAMSLGL